MLCGPSRGAARLVLGAVLAAAGCSASPGTPSGTAGTARSPAPAEFVGRSTCASCHAAENALWAGSQHDLAMQPAEAATVLGDFDNAAFRYGDVTTTFFRRNGRFVVRTDGPDGRLRDYPVAYTFGVSPLQQYLIEFPGGRLQALGIAWDTRPVAEGGQRWFHLYPDDHVTHDDVRHWTGFAQNWNLMCAECHSTNVRKGYDPAGDRYTTTWSELDVSCEACHGPGSRHVAWASAAASGAQPTPDRLGLLVDLQDRDGAVWTIDPKTGLAARSVPRASHTEVDTCARCHARRGLVYEDSVHGQPLLDTHELSLITDPLYFSDGQMRGEVYVYGSFLQSKMYERGVTCSSCHDPHSLEVRGEGNGRCAGCHLPARFDSPAHHLHPPQSAGASCVACHMPVRTYMQVDARRDHSFRIPRPDLTLTLGTPNACTGCHPDEPARWAADALAARYGRPPPSRVGETLDRARRGDPGAGSALVALAAGDAPGIIRATALSHLRGYPGPASLGAAERARTDPDPLVRLGAVAALEQLPPEARLGVLGPLLDDPVRVVRLDAARSLAAVSPDRLPAEARRALERGIDEYRAAQRLNADRAEAHVNLGVVHLERHELPDAAAAFERALARNPFFVPAYVNLAEVYRLQGRDAEGERRLMDALERVPDSADLYHALGLARVRLGRPTAALPALARAADLAPGRARYRYVYAIALHSSGRTDEALAELRRARARHPADVDVLAALATISRDAGRIDAALGYARALVALVPDDPGPRQLVAQLEAAR